MDDKPTVKCNDNEEEDAFVGYIMWRKPNSTERHVYPGNTSVLKTRDTFFAFLQKEGKLEGAIRNACYYLKDRTRVDVINDIDMDAFTSRLSQHKTVETALSLKIELSLSTTHRTECAAHYASFDDAVNLIRIRHAFITQAAVVSTTVLVAFSAILSTVYQYNPFATYAVGGLVGAAYAVVMAFVLIDSVWMARGQTARIMKRYNIDGTAFFRRSARCCYNYPNCENHTGTA